ncbi:MAG: glycosyltransferase family 2 protein, partial [Lacunisphaera sp.]
VVTPSFQQAHYLPDTLRSVLEQSGHIHTFVIQDGGSSDGSAEIIDSFASDWHHRTSTGHSPKAPVLLHESKKDSGQSDAIVTGFAKTSGSPTDLMAWMNSDDFYLPGALAFVVDYFARHPDVDVIYGHRVLVDENSQEIGRWFLPPHDADVLRLNDFVPQETLFWRRRVWDKVGGLDKTFKFAMDWDLLLRFQSAGARIVRVPFFLGCFRIHPAQKTSASMHDTGQAEITRLRERTFGRPFPPQELEQNPVLLRYLRQSAWIEFLWKLGIRAR